MKSKKTLPSGRRAGKTQWALEAVIEQVEETYKIKSLQDLAVAYRLAGEFDYSPDKDLRVEAEKFYGGPIADSVFSHSGQRQDEIACQIVWLIFSMGSNKVLAAIEGVK